MQLVFHVADQLPKLAWVARMDSRAKELRVWHGPAVEVGDGWFVEGVWDGPFEEGGFHRTEHFFGSGVRVEGDVVHFVPSTAIVDRILYFELDGALYASNSLLLLLAATGQRLDPDHDYRKDYNSLARGMQAYRRDLPVRPTNVTCIFQVVHEQLVVCEGEKRFESQSRVRDFASYEDYLGQVRDVLDRIRDNSLSPRRRRPMEAYTTSSSGYDSATATTLSQGVGVTKCFSSRRSNSALPKWLDRQAASDDGGPIATRLGMESLATEHDPRGDQFNELLLLAGTTGSPELVFLSMCDRIEREAPAAIVFTGYHGDVVWDIDPGDECLDDQIVRGGISGLGLSEVRLKAGFVNLAVAFLFGRSIASLNRIARSPEMAPWRLGNSYDRPIARRIVESAGVDRNLFGQRKKAVLSNAEFPMGPQGRQRFLAHLQKAYGVSPLAMRLRGWVHHLTFLLERSRRYVTSYRTAHNQKDKGVWFSKLPRHITRERFLWAVDECCQRLEQALGDDVLLDIRAARPADAVPAEPALARGPANSIAP
ncbi:MAG: hypothetical protein KF774_11755 [Planctomyces sp.]|nr:hypothetical protein [Planctomyces sp.]